MILRSCLTLLELGLSFSWVITLGVSGLTSSCPLFIVNVLGFFLRDLICLSHAAAFLHIREIFKDLDRIVQRIWVAVVTGCIYFRKILFFFGKGQLLTPWMLLFQRM